MGYKQTTLFDVMAAQGRTLAWLAKQVGCSRSYVSKMHRGQRRIPKWFAEKSSVAIGIPEHALFFDPMYADDINMDSSVIEEAA